MSRKKRLGHEYFIYPQPDFLKALTSGENSSFYTTRIWNMLGRVQEYRLHSLNERAQGPELDVLCRFSLILCKIPGKE